ncbi:MAG: alpha/beta hydrolase [Thermodesulfobacteriota bacterium]|nr:alpha/beta hydrolase [Thermodesulfobacteriota bacterium]
MKSRNKTIISMSKILIFILVSCFVGAIHASAQWPGVVPSRDGTPIAYEVFGTGEPALVFVHGWSCDARYWRKQIPVFSKNHKVVTMDLAGHGHSGSGRERYTMRAFGEDVRAVTLAAGSNQVILVGHSMGGSVIAEAARLMPKRVIGLIGVDTLENIEHPMTEEDLNQMASPLEKDFPAGVHAFVDGMISKKTDPDLRSWVLADMASAPPDVAVSAFREMATQYITGAAASIFETIKVPVISLNGDLWPVNYEANRRHMMSYDAIVLNDADHFLMMNRADEFNRALANAIATITGKSK